MKTLYLKWLSLVLAVSFLATPVYSGTVQSPTTGTGAEVDANFKALRFAVKPMDYGSQGAFTYGGISGVIPAALAANSEVFQFRWVDATRVAIIRKIRVSAAVSTTFFGLGVPIQLDLVKATAWTAQGTGGTGVSPAAMLKRRSTMASTVLGANDMRIITTAALGTGTKTLETYSLSTILATGPTSSVAGGTIIEPGTILWQAEVGDGEHPLILAQNEGFVIRSVAVPAGGTWMLTVNVDWAEATSY